MKLTKKQIEDLKNKLHQVEEIIGFPINKKQLDQLKIIDWIKSEIISEEEKSINLPIPIEIMDTSIERAIDLFEEYLNE